MYNAIFLLIIFILYWFQLYGVTPLSYTIGITTITVLILLIIKINKAKKLRQKANNILINCEIRRSRIAIALYLIFVALFVFLIIISKNNNNIINLYILLWGTIIRLYYDVFTRSFLVTDQGVLIQDTLIRWSDIESYGWKTPVFLKDHVTLLLKKKTKIVFRELSLCIKNSQRAEIDEILRQRIGVINNESY